MNTLLYCLTVCGDVGWSWCLRSKEFAVGDYIDIKVSCAYHKGMPASQALLICSWIVDLDRMFPSTLLFHSCPRAHQSRPNTGRLWPIFAIFNWITGIPVSCKSGSRDKSNRLGARFSVGPAGVLTNLQETVHHAKISLIRLNVNTNLIIKIKLKTIEPWCLWWWIFFLWCWSTLCSIGLEGEFLFFQFLLHKITLILTYSLTINLPPDDQVNN